MEQEKPSFLQRDPLMRNTSPFKCTVCFKQVQSHAGIVLRNCFHSFCLDCLKIYAENTSPVARLECSEQRCVTPLLESEIHALNQPVFHCRAVGCPGWIVPSSTAAEAADFVCSVCDTPNCLACRTVHAGQTCEEFKRCGSDKEPEEIAEGVREMEYYEQEMARLRGELEKRSEDYREECADVIEQMRRERAAASFDS